MQDVHAAMLRIMDIRQPFAIFEVFCVIFFILWRLYGILRVPEGIPSSNAVYSVPTPWNHYTMVSSAHHIEEVRGASEEQLSFEAIGEEMFHYTHLFHGFTPDRILRPKGRISQRVVRGLFMQHLPTLKPTILHKIDAAFETSINSRLAGGKANLSLTGSSSPKSSSLEWVSVPIVAMCRRVVGDLTILHVLGNHLTDDPSMMAAASQFPEDAIYVGEALRYVPNLFASGVASIVTQRHRALRTLVNGLYPVVVERLKKHISEGEVEDKPLDAIQWIIDASPKKNPWTIERFLREIIGHLIFSSHAPKFALVMAIYSLCLHPEYLEPLRVEAQAATSHDFANEAEEMPLMDSFLRESARLNPIDGGN
ncbi:MAG: hypothetical protein Q9222_002861 [Ikaeria aurantiellina]